MGYNSRLRSGGNANLSPNVASRQYGTQSDAARMVRVPPGDVLKQTASGATLRTMAGGANAPLPVALERDINFTFRPPVADSPAANGTDTSALLERIAVLLEAGLKTPPSVNDSLRYAPTYASIPLNIGTVNQLVLNRATNKRVYLFIVNTHPTQRMFVTFGQQSTVLLGVPLAANLGSFEWLFTVPQADVHIIANGAGTTGVLLYAEML
jgi:hypothetical protein